MVSDDDRDYMHREYSKDPRMRLNMGIRRRLAPLMDNGRRHIELLYSLLFTLAGWVAVAATHSRSLPRQTALER
jgi:maltose alpha-D-glucosyltransferase/alpha-amylase